MHRFFFFFFFNDTATTEIYTLSLHDALPICRARVTRQAPTRCGRGSRTRSGSADRKSTRLNSSHEKISYAVFCLQKKKRADGSERGRRRIAILHRPEDGPRAARGVGRRGLELPRGACREEAYPQFIVARFGDRLHEGDEPLGRPRAGLA